MKMPDTDRKQNQEVKTEKSEQQVFFPSPSPLGYKNSGTISICLFL
jgi:hypothetical protein